MTNVHRSRVDKTLTDRQSHSSKQCHVVNPLQRQSAGHASVIYLHVAKCHWPISCRLRHSTANRPRRWLL